MEKSFKWAKELEDHKIIEDIPGRMRRLETKYWTLIGLGMASIVCGLMCFAIAPEHSLKLQLVGPLGVMFGCFCILAITVQAGISRTMLWILWDSRNRLEAEMDKMNAADL